MTAKIFTELIAWQKAHQFVLQVYAITRGFPDTERFGLVTQMRRAAVSIPANIAEGFIKEGKADRLRYLNIAQGSIEESRYYLILTQDLGYADCQPFHGLLEEVSKLVYAYKKSFSNFQD